MGDLDIAFGDFLRDWQRNNRNHHHYRRIIHGSATVIATVLRKALIATTTLHLHNNMSVCVPAPDQLQCCLELIVQIRCN